MNSHYAFDACDFLSLILLFFFFFFFSSRRRHTRSLRDWSSDVCSSDLSPTGASASNADDGSAASPARSRIVVASASVWPRIVGTVVYAPGPICRRSEERRVGKECRCRWWADHEKKKDKRRRERSIGMER